MLKYTLSLVTLSISLSCVAQISVGVRAGWNYSNLITSENVAYDFKPGYMIATYLKARIHDKMSLQPEPQFTSIGFKAPNFFNVTSTLTYLSMPAFFGYEVNKVINVYAGPQLSLLLTAQEMYDQGRTTFDSRDSHRIFDVGAAFGVGLNFARFDIGFRYYRTLPFSLRNDRSGDSLLDMYYGSKNTYLQISAGYRFWSN